MLLGWEVVERLRILGAVLRQYISFRRRATWDSVSEHVCRVYMHECKVCSNNILGRPQQAVSRHFA